MERVGGRRKKEIKNKTKERDGRGKKKEEKERRREGKEILSKMAFSALTTFESIHFIPCVFLMMCLLPV